MSKPREKFEGGDPILRSEAAAKYLGVGRQTLYRWVKLGAMPAPARLGPGARGWRLSVLDAWVKSCEESPVADADSQAAKGNR